MALQEPESMDECLYFTNRTVDNGKIMAWVLRKQCPQCKQGSMGKALNEKTGKVNKKAEEYSCRNCHYTEDALTHEKSLMLSVKYTCPHCNVSGETTTDYQQKNFEGVKAYVFECNGCKKRIPITKKMKNPKKKGNNDNED